MVCCPPWTLVLTARALKSLLALAFGCTILQVARALTTTGDFLVLGAYCITTFAEKTSFATTCSFTALQFTCAMATAGNLASTFPTARTVPVAAFTNEAANTLASRSVTTWCAFAVTIANIAIGVGRTFHMAFVASVSFLADTLGIFRLRVQEACALARTHTTLAQRTFDTTILPEEPFLTLANCLSLVALFYTCASCFASTNTP